uniref:Wuschel-like homeobox 11B n=1 Tax=Selaginella kraussiana TaxID=81964 RepID=A0A0P0M056_9TRAC|nr:wuschel-like homeobox 11B [Selaginella kraussiana]
MLPCQESRPLPEQQLDKQEGELPTQHTEVQDAVDPRAIRPNRRRGQRLWRPTLEQLDCLEAFYRTNDYAPNRIPVITEMVSQYGHVEKCQVYYWFNKRRSRDMRRAIFLKQVELQQQLQQ